MNAFGAKPWVSAARIARCGAKKPSTNAVAADISRKPRRERFGKCSESGDVAKDFECSGMMIRPPTPRV
jgi:hypothetical protein